MCKKMKLDLNEICNEIAKLLTSNEVNTLIIHYKNPGNGVTYEIDGNKCKSNVSFWPNGNCDIDYVLTKNNKSTNKQIELKTKEEAINIIIKEIKEAFKRA